MSGNVARISASVFINDCITSYDLEMDKKLAEETTVLVECYTVSTCKGNLRNLIFDRFESSLTAGLSKSAQNVMRLLNACSNRIS